MTAVVANPELCRAVADAVRLVNTNSGQACIRLRYADDGGELDFVANSAQIDGQHFCFTAGFETYGGSIEDLADISAQLIGRPS